jgi:peptidoglycan/xylan/chitin deacetylase (PgdA/CDA1 family)
MDQVILPIRAKPRVGTLIISLDFEIYWGIRHLPSADKYRRQLVGARSAVPELLKLFTEYGIHACVGFLFFDSTERLLRFAPKVIPRYKSIHLSPYRDLPPDDASETSDSVFFAPSLIRLIAQTPNQEIGSHTFSHYYCLEEGQNLKTFREDLLAARGTAQSFGLKMRSLAFPQNQVQERFLAVCREIGIVAYRGNQDSRIYRASSEHERKYVNRLARFADAYVPLVATAYPLPRPTSDLPINLPASRFLRPYSRTSLPFERQRLRRIVRELTHAAQMGLCYHLWWHPHNFGADMHENLAFLRRILNHYRALERHYGMRSATMGETADLVLNLNQVRAEPRADANRA